jgi:2-polyprenyl-6-methoxyphenol hydroxylase-like FAD-dependent oxidoreductase
MRKATIIGGSLGGLLAGNLLLKAGWDVHIFERSAEELAGRGAGLATHPELMDILAEAGVAAGPEIGVPLTERITLSREGAVVGRRTEPQVMTAWSRLFHDLRDVFPRERYHNGRVLTGVSETADGVTARFADGSEVVSDLLVAADGIRSTVRALLLPEARPVYAGYVAWRGMVDESDLSPRAQAEVLPYFAFGLPPTEQFLTYPVAGRSNSTAPGQRRMNFVWYRPADETGALRDMLTDANGKCWPEGIPPPLIRPQVLESARAAARAILAPQFAEIVDKAAQLFFQPIFDLESPRLAFGRVALLGDAAFVARPHCGMGVTKAGADARVLVQALATHPDVCAAVEAYGRQRVDFGRFIVGHARALGAYMQAQIRTPEERAMAEKYHTVEAVMRETAVPPVVH